MTAMPPMTIHGAPAPSSARARAASASSRSRSPFARLAGTLLNARPTAAHLLDGTFAHRIAWAGPLARRCQRRRRRERLGHRLLRTRPLRAHQFALARRRRLLPAAHSQDGTVVTHTSRLPHGGAMVLPARGRAGGLSPASAARPGEGPRSGRFGGRGRLNVGMLPSEEAERCTMHRTPSTERLL